MNQKYKLTSDNKQPARTIHLTSEEIELYCKKYLRWRTSKQYTTITHRFLNTSSSKYDYLIEQVYQSQINER